MNPLSLLSGLAGPAIVVAAVAAAFGFGFYKGDVHRGQIDGAAGAQEQIVFLQKQVAARDAAAKQDAAQAAADQAALTAQVEKANAIIAKIPPGGVCLTGDDVNGLRKFWNAGHRKH